MKYNLYSLNKINKIEKINTEGIDTNISYKIKLIEDSIIAEYLKKQEGMLGIKNLGNEIRLNPKIKSQFNSVDGNCILVKLTENRRSFLKIFCDAVINFSQSKLYFLILERDFGNQSNLVDKSFISISEIKEQLYDFFQHFSIQHRMLQVYFLEFTGFDEYYISNNAEFSKIKKIQDYE